MSDPLNGFADVAVDLPLENPLSYRIPLPLQERIRPGCLVRVPLRSREVVGTVLEVHDRSPREPEVREILDLVEEVPFFSPEDLSWYRWAARYYLHPLGQVLDTGIPRVSRTPSRSRKRSIGSAAPLEDPELRPPPTLTPHQAEAVAPIESAMRRERFHAFLLWGVTGSGKTEIYLRSAESCLLRGQQTILLVPEISLTHQLVREFRSRFGERIAVLHSRLSRGEREDMWRAVHAGRRPIVLGARSAVFAPCRHLGLIIVDEEHDPSYKQEEGFRYHARDLALMRGKLAGGVVLLGSATPALETHFNVEQGKITCLRLPERLEGSSLPQTEIVDLRHRKRHGGSALSPALQGAMAETLERGEQILLFLNRRGYATFLLCPDCGHVFQCPNCAVTLVHHRARGALLCHYCGWEQPAAAMCPKCQGMEISELGLGTETLEVEVRERFPGARVLRMDRDTTSRKHAHAEILRSWRRGEADILIGTQMVAKGHHVPNVTLVGVVLADTSLNIPDFRASERTFQLLLQVAGRAGRGRRPGRVVVQTYHPRHPSILLAAAQDPSSFAAQEMALRKEAGYPPFRHLVLFRVSSSREEEALAAARLLGNLAHPICGKRPGLVCLGPSPAPLGKLKGRFRWQLLLKGEARPDLHRVARHLLETTRSRISSRIRLTVDVDPQSFL